MVLVETQSVVAMETLSAMVVMEKPVTKLGGSLPHPRCTLSFSYRQMMILHKVHKVLVENKKELLLKAQRFAHYYLRNLQS